MTEDEELYECPSCGGWPAWFTEEGDHLCDECWVLYGKEW